MKINLFLSALFAVMVSVTSGAEIVITGNDTMQFDLKAFEVKAGEKVSLTLKNTGKLPKIAMGHNLVLLKKGVSAITFWAKGYGCRSKCDQSILSGACNCQHQTPRSGESDTVSFTAPADPGNYEYVCTFPGHFAMMRGTMTVK